MNDAQFNDRTGWLKLNLAAGRNNIAALLLRLKSIGVRAGTSLGLHRKFMGLLEQIAVDHEKELDILNEIQDVEKRHEQMRTRHLLRRAHTPETAPYALPIPANKERPSRTSLLTIFGLLYLLSAAPVKHKHEKLTAD